MIPHHHWPLAISAVGEGAHDFAGAFMGSIFFVIVDSHPRLEVVLMETTTAEGALDVLRSLFALTKAIGL